MPAFQKHTKTIQRAPVPMADVCAELGIPADAETRDLCRALLVRAFGFPADTTVDLGANEVVFTWEGGSEPAPEKPVASKKKKEEPVVVAPPPVEVDWATALKDGARIGAADIKRAEEEIGAARVAEVRGRLSLGAGVTHAQISLSSLAKDYFDALRAAA